METRITLPFAEAEYQFWLPMPRVIAAEREMGWRDEAGAHHSKSIFALFYELGEGLAAGPGGSLVIAAAMPARIFDCHAIIRNALVGGCDDSSQNDQTARELVSTYCYPTRPALHDVSLAWEILRAAIYGIDSAALGKKKAEGASADPQPS